VPKKSQPQHIIQSDGQQEWWVNGELHRTAGPAVIWANGHQEWWVNGELHRTDGPAVIWADGHQEWWVNCELHRLDGPAVIWANGKKSWFINNRNITDEVEKWLQQQGVIWPWNDATQAQFALTFL